MDKKTVLFFGKSGSGKGTQAKLLRDHLEKNTDRKVLYIETGDKLREFVKEDNYSSKLTKEIIGSGELMPEFLPIWLWSDHLVKNFTGEEHMILDGLSRRADEAPVLESALKFYKIKNPTVIYLNVSRKRAFELLKGRGRKDDTDEYINNRLDWFDENVVPAMDYFKNDGYATFVDINGEQSIEEVHTDVLKALGLK